MGPGRLAVTWSSGMAEKQRLRILFLSHRNTARGVIAEALANAIGHGQFEAFSAPDSPPLDFVFTLSDTAAGEAPPMWPGHPITAHWRCTDPSQFDDLHDKRRALLRTYSELERRLRVFVNLPVDSLDRMSLQAHLDSLGRGRDG
jgi:arsenate reductase (thioredoxin)